MILHECILIVSSSTGSLAVMANLVLRSSLKNLNVRGLRRQRTDHRSLSAHAWSSSDGSSSTSSSSSSDYLKTITKKFIFQVHPDYFLQHQSEQSVNSKNVATLQDILFGFASRGGTSSSSAPRSLIFYLKPTDTDPRPRRVKIAVSSLKQIEESISDVLETLGVELPERPEGQTIVQKSYVSSNPAEVAVFLDTLIDRKDLMAWRLERSENFDRLQDIVQQSLGVDGIDIRYSWSAQNNSVLLKSMMQLIGLTLVLSSDECSELPVDPIEAHVMINPAHVPLQWLRVFRSVKGSVLQAAADCKLEIDTLTNKLSRTASARLRAAVVHDSGMQEEYKKNRDDKHKNKKNRGGGIDFGPDSLRGVTVQIKRGYTCSKRKYLSLLRGLDAHESNTAAVPVTSYDELVLEELRQEFEEYAKRQRRRGAVTVGDSRVFEDDYDDDDSEESLTLYEKGEEEDENSNKAAKDVVTDNDNVVPVHASARNTPVSTTPLNETEDRGSTEERMGEEQGDRAPKPSSSSSGGLLVIDTNNNNNNTSLSETVNFLRQLPLQITLIVEEGHGTKLLSTGELRIDCRASASVIWHLIYAKGFESVKLAAEQKKLRDQIEELRHAVVSSLGLISIEAGVGVNDTMMESCLRRMDEYNVGPSVTRSTTVEGNTATAQSRKGKLRGLSGLRVKIGRYLGLSDDGSCIIPWDWQL